jgi:DNA-binding LytR/AlgR family response regulator
MNDLVKHDDLMVFGDPRSPGDLRRISEIVCLEACENYTRVNFLAGDSALIRKPLRACEARFDPKRFFRVGRSCIVNLAHVKTMRRIDGPAQRFVFVLVNDREVPVSRRQSAQLKQMML